MCWDAHEIGWKGPGISFGVDAPRVYFSTRKKGNGTRAQVTSYPEWLVSWQALTPARGRECNELDLFKWSPHFSPEPEERIENSDDGVIELAPNRPSFDEN
jgi:hypothetical protein